MFINRTLVSSFQTQMGMFGGMPPMPNMMPPYNFQRGPPYPPYQMVSMLTAGLVHVDFESMLIVSV